MNNVGAYFEERDLISSDSKEIEFFEKIKGKNIRATSLIPGTWYIVMERTTTHHLNYENPYEFVQYLGIGNPDTEEYQRIKIGNLKNVESPPYAVFKTFDSRDGSTYIYGMYEFEGALSQGSGATPVSFYKII